MFTFNNISQNENKRLSAINSSLKPDCRSIKVAEKSNQPEDLLLHPVGYVFQFYAQKFKSLKFVFEVKEF